MPEYAKLVAEWPLPQTRRELRAFLGKSGYYRRFLKDYAKRALPLTAKLAQDGVKDNAPLQHDPAFVKAFNDLRSALVSAPVLAHPIFDDPKATFILDTDWSCQNEAIGGVLSQIQDGVERVIAYGGIKLNGAQTRYSSYKGEAFALLAFIKKWSYFLRWRKFLVRTDHHSLKYLHSSDPPDLFTQRWLDTLATFDFEVVYRKGSQHGNADALSRAGHLKEWSSDTNEDDNILAAMTHPTVKSPIVAARAAAAPPMQTPDQARREQEQDSELQKAVDDLDYRGPWSEGEPTRGPDGVIYCSVNNKRVLAIPAHRQVEAIKAAHWLSAHQGRDATLHRLRQSAWFPRMRPQVAEMIAGCQPCITKSAPLPQRAQFNVTKASHPFEMWSMDFVGPLPRATQGQQYLLTLRCPYTKWQEAFATKDMTAATVIRHLTNDIFPRFGLPLRLHSDCGPAFRSSELKAIGEALNIKTTFTPPYNPKSNPVERAHHDLVKALTALSGDKPSTWVQYLPMVLYALRCAPCRVTGVSPFQAAFGREPDVDYELFFRLPDETWRTKDLTSYARELREKMQQTHALMADKLKDYVLAKKRKYRATLRQYHPNDRVTIFTPKPVVGSQKFKNVFWTGPYKIVKKINDVTYVVVGDSSDLPTREQIVSIDRIRPFGPHTAFTTVNWPSMPELRQRQAEVTGTGTPDDDDVGFFDPTATSTVTATAAAPAPAPVLAPAPVPPMAKPVQPGPPTAATGAIPKRPTTATAPAPAPAADADQSTIDAAKATQEGMAAFAEAIIKLQGGDQDFTPQRTSTETAESSPARGLDVTLRRVQEESEDEFDASFVSAGDNTFVATEDEDQGGGERAPTPTERELQRLQQEREEQRRRSEEQSSARAERARRRSANKDALQLGKEEDG